MNNEELDKKICKYLFNLTYTELHELKLNGQQIVKIKKGEPVKFYSKTRERLRKLVEKKVA